MRLVVEIVVIGLLVWLSVSFFMDKREVKDELKDSQEKVERLEGKVGSLNDSLNVLEQDRDSLSHKSDSLKNKIKDITGDVKRIQEAYKDSIEAIQEAKLSNLIDSSRIIIKGSKTFVLVSEKYYRQARINEVDLERLESIVGIYRNKVQLQDSLIEIKDEEIMNLMHQVAVYKHKVGLKDSVITEKDMQLNMKDSQLKKYKTQRNVAVGGILGTIILILL